MLVLNEQLNFHVTSDGIRLILQATVGVGFEYLLLRSCSPLIFEQIVQNKAWNGRSVKSSCANLAQRDSESESLADTDHQKLDLPMK